MNIMRVEIDDNIIDNIFDFRTPSFNGIVTSLDLSNSISLMSKGIVTAKTFKQIAEKINIIFSSIGTNNSTAGKKTEKYDQANAIINILKYLIFLKCE